MGKGQCFPITHRMGYKGQLPLHGLASAFHPSVIFHCVPTLFC